MGTDRIREIRSGRVLRWARHRALFVAAIGGLLLLLLATPNQAQNGGGPPDWVVPYSADLSGDAFLDFMVASPSGQGKSPAPVRSTFSPAATMPCSTHWSAAGIKIGLATPWLSLVISTAMDLMTCSSGPPRTRPARRLCSMPVRHSSNRRYSQQRGHGFHQLSPAGL